MKALPVPLGDLALRGGLEFETSLTRKPGVIIEYRYKRTKTPNVVCLLDGQEVQLHPGVLVIEIESPNPLSGDQRDVE
jgi:hypothetical protein